MFPRTSLVVLIFNNSQVTIRCLRSLIASFTYDDLANGIELLLVDNGSNAEDRGQLADFMQHPLQAGLEWRLLQQPVNWGYPLGMNIGIAQCRGSIVGTLNNDLIFPRGWLTPLIAALGSDLSIGFAVPYLSYAPSIQHVDVELHTDTEIQQFADFFTNHNRYKQQATNQVIGACLLMRRDLLDKIGGHDLWYGIGNYDDDDWCMRARIAGYRIVAVGASFVYHAGHATFNQLSNYNAILATNAGKFARKWQVSLDRANTSASREEQIRRTAFDRSKHFNPIQFSERNHCETVLYTRSSDARRLLLCADWLLPGSRIAETLAALLRLRQSYELCFWVPSAMYDINLVANQIEGWLRAAAIPDSSGIRAAAFLIFPQTAPCNEMNHVLASADCYLLVPGDYVNLAFSQAAEQMDLSIVKVNQ